MENPVIIIGADNIGKVVYEIFSLNNILCYGFLDDDESKLNTEIEDVMVLGMTNDNSFLELIGKKCEVFIASDDILTRKTHIRNLRVERKVFPINCIHPNALISNTAIIGYGNLINSGVDIGTNAKIGNANSIGKGAIIDHHSSIGDYVIVGNGSIINQNVIIDSEVIIGSGCVISSGVKIGKGTLIGPGSVVINNINENEVVFGNPAVRK